MRLWYGTSCTAARRLGISTLAECVRLADEVYQARQIPGAKPMRVNYVIIFVSEMARSVAFYRDTIGLTLKFETSTWTEFATDGATLALHAHRSGAGGTSEAGAAGTGRCRPGLSVPSLANFHARMLEQGVPCVQVPSAVFGSLVAQYSDPDGLIFSVAEGDPEPQ